MSEFEESAHPGRPSAGAEATPLEMEEAGVSQRRWIWSAALAAGILASGVTWAAAETAVGRVVPDFGGDKGPLAGGVDLQTVNRALVNEAALGYGLQGGLLGLLLGLARGAARGSTRAAGSAGLLGLLL